MSNQKKLYIIHYVEVSKIEKDTKEINGRDVDFFVIKGKSLTTGNGFKGEGFINTLQGAVTKNAETARKLRPGMTAKIVMELNDKGYETLSFVNLIDPADLPIPEDEITKASEIRDRLINANPDARARMGSNGSGNGSGGATSMVMVAAAMVDTTKSIDERVAELKLIYSQIKALDLDAPDAREEIDDFNARQNHTDVPAEPVEDIPF